MKQLGCVLEFVLSGRWWEEGRIMRRELGELMLKLNILEWECVLVAEMLLRQPYSTLECREAVGVQHPVKHALGGGG